MEIRSVKCQGTQQEAQVPNSGVLRIPLEIHTADRWRCSQVNTHYNILTDQETCTDWQSTSAGLYIGQEYTAIDNNKRSTKYLALTGDEKKLGLVDDPPELQENQALQREFLAALAVVVIANRIPSRQFIAAVEVMMSNIQLTMSKTWYKFGSKDLMDAVIAAKTTLIWREWL